MGIISEQVRAAKWLEEYANKPIINPTYEEAIAKLIKLGETFPSDKIAREYDNSIIENN